MKLPFIKFHNHEPQFSPEALRWSHDRRIIANWLQRETGGNFDGAEIRGDGSSYIAFPSTVGQLSVHDYWSFARPEFTPNQRAASYAEILSRQVPILTLGYTRPGDSALQRTELVVFLHGELMVDQGYAEAFAPLTVGQPLGALMAVQSTQNAAGLAKVELYSDPFLVSVVEAIKRQTQQPPALVSPPSV